MLAAGVAIVGVCAAWMVWRQHEHPKPLSDPPNMARFQAADVYLGVFAALPDDCRQLPIDENCAEWRHPESVQVTHIAAFELDRKEATNDDFSAWLNTHTNDWSLETDGVVTDQKTHLPLLATTACTGDLSISPGGRAEPTAGAAQRPVTCVTWYGAEVYCGAQNKRLPLEAEWELAAKGAAGRPFPWGADADHLDGVAYHLSDPRTVGTSAKDVSPEGVYDLAGNIAEWIQSERNTPDKRVIRGGSYLSDGACRLLSSKCARISVRNVGRNVGFRCARNVDEPAQAQERTQ
jgi:formylglycine-generating enzyme required for sulfatase activity